MASLAELTMGPETYSQLRPGSVRSGTQVSGGGQSAAWTQDCPSWSCTGIRHAVTVTASAAAPVASANLPTVPSSIRGTAIGSARVHPLGDDQPLRVQRELVRGLRRHGAVDEDLVADHRRHQARAEEARVRFV